MPSPGHRTPVPLVLDEGIKVACIVHAGNRASAAKSVEGVQRCIDQLIPHIIADGERLAARVSTLQTVYSRRCELGKVENSIVAAGVVERPDREPGNHCTGVDIEQRKCLRAPRAAISKFACACPIAEVRIGDLSWRYGPPTHGLDLDLFQA